jgi:hypothetical protein
VLPYLSHLNIVVIKRLQHEQEPFVALHTR